MERKKRASPKKNNVPKMKDLPAQERRLALLKQKQCDAVALHIVRKLIDCPVEEDVFLQSLRYMNQCHYQDIVEERAIGKMCGYPICGNKIPDMPSKKYHISTKLNKVYDITDRKNYCSNYCYKAGIYVKDQMLTSPLWFRDKEQIPDFHLLLRTETGVPGVEIDQGIVKVDVNADEQFTSITKFTQDMINDIPDEICGDLNDKCKEKLIPKKEKVTTKVSNKKDVEQDKNQEPLIKIQREESYVYSNLYMPSLADILKENAEYFGKETEEIDEPVANTASQEIIEKNKNIPKIEILENISTEVQVDKPKGFDRTIINTGSSKTNICTESEDDSKKMKGILSKGNMSKRKRVSFTEGHLIREYVKEEKINEEHMNTMNKKFKKPLATDNENKMKGIYKNVNVLGVVQERSTILLPVQTSNDKTKSIDRIERVTKSIITENNMKRETNNENKNSGLEKSMTGETIIQSTNKNNFIINDKSDNTTINIVNKQPDEKLKYKNLEKETNEYKIQETNAVTKSDSNKNDNNDSQVENKQKRMSRLKNSSVYKKANNMSKAKLANVKLTTEQPNINTRMKQCLKEWLTIETTIFLYGEEHVKQILSEKSYKQYLNRKKNLELDEIKQQQYDEICKRINLMDMADRKFDETVTGKKLRPLPKYDELKDQAETMDLKVRAFYSGFYEVHEEDLESDAESAKEEEESDNVQGAPAVLPLIDSKDLMQTRKRIFLLSLRRVIPSVCEILKQCPHTILSDLKQLINTFAFTANNIVFKTPEWPVVAVLLIQLLSLRDKELQSAMETEEGQLYITSLASQFNIMARDIEEFIAKTSEIYNYLKDCVDKVNNIA